MIHPYTPLLTLILSWLYKLLGYKLLVMQGFAWSLLLVNDIFVFLIVRKLTKKDLPGLLALSFYVIAQPFLEGNMLWPDTAIVTPILIGTYFLKDKKFFWSGIFLAVAALTKQTAGLFLVVGFGYLLYKKEKIESLAKFLAGPIALGAIFLFSLLATHQLSAFFNWTLFFPSKYWTSFPGYVDTVLTKRELLTVAVLFAPTILGFTKLKKYPLLPFFLLAAVIIVYPRFSFFHFQSAIAFSAILFGLTLNKTKGLAYLGLVLVLVAMPSIRLNWQKPPRFYTDADFKISSALPEGKKVYLLNLPSSYYVFSKSFPPKPWVDNFGWYYAAPGVEDEVLSALQDNSPDYLLWKEAEVGEWWELGTYEPQNIRNWIKTNYNMREEVEKGIWLWTKN